MKLGLLVEAEEGLTWELWRPLFKAAEALGFQSLWLADHLQSPWSAERHGLDAWVALTVAAAETARIQLGTLVSPVTFREPAIVARMAEALHALSAGRLTVGLGVGWNVAEHRAHGIMFPPRAERTVRLVATIEAVRAALGPGHVLIGGMGEATLGLVARYADAWNLTTGSASTYRARATRLDELCRTEGREPHAIRRSVAVGALAGFDLPDVRARGARLRRLVAPLAENADSLAAARAMGWLVGTPTELRAQLQPLAQAGVEEAMFGVYDFEDLEALRVLREAT